MPVGGFGPATPAITASAGLHAIPDTDANGNAAAPASSGSRADPDTNADAGTCAPSPGGRASSGTGAHTNTRAASVSGAA